MGLLRRDRILPGTFLGRESLRDVLKYFKVTEDDGMKLAFLVSTVVAIGLVTAVSASPTPATERYAYGSPAFTRLVADSMTANGGGRPQAFYAWMDKACRRHLRGKQTWVEALAQRRQEMERIADPRKKAQREMQIAAWLHQTVKTDIPHFSLDRGFEFINAMRRGERQCLLQSVIVAGMLQAMDADAGIVMVNRSLGGQTSNNGHVVCLLKRPDARDVLVDCSDQTPFVRHQGLMAAQSATDLYRYIEPVYAVPNSGVIASYRTQGSGQTVPIGILRPLDYSFVRSQFYFYRGERTPGGLLSPQKTAVGLAREARELRTAVEICPRNPLAVYMLGRVYLKQGQREPARAALRQAKGLYVRFGWTPQGLRDAYAEAGMPMGKSARL